MKYGLLLRELTFMLFIFHSKTESRVKRDDGSFAQDFGGPVAQALEPEEFPENENGDPPVSADLEKTNSYTFLATVVCDLDLCFKICKSLPSCNYIVRSSRTFSTQMLRVDAAKLTEGKFILFEDFDSYGLFCQEGERQPRSQLPAARSNDSSYAALSMQSVTDHQTLTIQTQSTSEQQPSPKPVLSTSQPTLAGNNQQCTFVKKERQVLSKLSNKPGAQRQTTPAATNATSITGKDNFRLLNSTTCNTLDECFKRCKALSDCNYIKRSRLNSASQLYSVKSEFLNGNYIKSLTDDSFVLNCSNARANGATQLNREENKVDLPPTEKSTPAQYISTIENKIDVQGPRLTDHCLRLLSEPERLQKFNAFSTVYNKTYSNEEQRRDSYQSFKDNLQIIQKLGCDAQNNNNKAQFKINNFTDVLNEEFARKQLGGLFDVGRTHLSLDSIPEAQAVLLGQLGKTLIAECPKFSWQDQGVISDARDQKGCSASFAFATADLLSAQYQIDHGIKDASFLLSPQYIIDCTPTPTSLGCRGGRPIEVLRSFANCNDPTGCSIPKEDCYPYQGVQGNCQKKPCQESQKISVKWAANINAVGKLEKETIATILHYGPAVVGIDALHSWQFFSGKGILHADQCNADHHNHMALLVGYDFIGPVPYFIVKNSWGKDWGDQGYIKLEAGKNTCNLAESLVVTCTKDCLNFRSISDIAKLKNTDQCKIKTRLSGQLHNGKLLPTGQPLFGTLVQPDLPPSVQPSEPGFSKPYLV